jgi:hypothetical protein
MSNNRRIFTAVGHEFQWVRKKTLELCSDCAFHMPGPYAGLCEASSSIFDCVGEKYGAWKETGEGK